MVKFSDYFNSTTLKGRANVAKATCASFAALYLYHHFKNSKKIPVEQSEKRYKGTTNRGNDNNKEQKTYPCCDKCKEQSSGDGHRNSPDYHGNMLPKSYNHNHTAVNEEAIDKSSKSKRESSSGREQTITSPNSNGKTRVCRDDDNNFLWWHPW